MMSADRAFFVTQDANHKGALWVTDGTASGTRQVQVAGASSLGLDPSNLVVSAAGMLFFSGSDSAGRSGLWVSDGTDAGTRELSVAGAPGSGLSPSGIVAYGNGVAFTSLSGTGLWVSDGTDAGTARVPLPGQLPDQSYIANLTVFRGKLYFSGQTGLVNTTLWSSDGTASGTQSLPVPGVSSFGLAPVSIASLGTKLVLSGTGASFTQGLWVSDGTASGTVPLAVPGLGTTASLGSGGPAGLYAFGGGKAAFVAQDAAGQQAVWVTDGTVAGTQELPGMHVGASGAPMAALPGGRLAFIAADASGTNQVWVTDGTGAGTQVIHAPGTTAALNPHAVIALGGQLLFDGQDASGVSRLWTSDGTSPGTSVLGTGTLAPGNGAATSAVVPGTSAPFAWNNTSTAVTSGGSGETYTGPVSYLQAQYLWPGTDSVNIDAHVANVFLRSGPGFDALRAVAGSNVLDGGTGSNFLVGADGSDGGTDTFFTDARGANVVWNTVVNFHSGDAVTLWGFTGGTSNMVWSESDGAEGFKGATIHAEIAGAGTGVNGSVTFAGVSLADAQSKFAMATGSTGGNDYLYVKYVG